MTQQEKTNRRSLVFSGWIRTHLPDSSTGYCVGNQDWIYYNWAQKKLMLAEEKTRGAEVSKWFALFIRTIMHPALKEYCAKIGIDYRGYHLIQFEHEGPEDGKIFFDRKEVTSEKLARILSFKDDIV